MRISAEPGRPGRSPACDSLPIPYTFRRSESISLPVIRPSFCQSSWPGNSADLLVMGAVSRSWFRKALIGYTAERVLDKTDCDLLIVKLPA